MIIHQLKSSPPLGIGTFLWLENGDLHNLNNGIRRQKFLTSAIIDFQMYCALF